MTMMLRMPEMPTRFVVSVFVAVVALGVIVEAKIKVRAEPDPAFNFSTVKTWAWDDEAGKVYMKRYATDAEAAPLQERIEPAIRKYVGEAMAKTGLALASNAAPDVQLHYYVLVTVGVTGHEMGQFLPAVPYWGLPPFPPATTSLNVVTNGSLILDAMLPGTAGERRVVWRGVAQSTVEDDDSPEKRDARLREASTELVKRFPVKKK
jgi:Domain of unknown function (DUF4136)